MRATFINRSNISRITATLLLVCFVTSNAAFAAAFRPNTADNVSVFLTDMTDLGSKGRVIKIAGLENETNRLVTSLSAKNTKHPLLLSEDNAIRHDLVDQLALKMTSENASGISAQKLIRLEMQNLFSGASSLSEASSIIEKIIAENYNNEIILFIDDVTALLRLQGDSFSKAIEGSKIKIIAGASFAEYLRFIEKTDHAELFEIHQLNANQTIEGSRRSDSDENFRGDNISSDIREMIKGGKTEQKLNVILQANNSHNSHLINMLRSGGADISHIFPDGRNLAAALPLGLIEKLANSGLINYISPDRPTRTTGHIEETTGLTLARQFASSNNGSVAYRGTGVGIAVFDSGVDPDHNGFKDNNGNSRIKASVDFTATGNNDGYGHGTHVAGLAAGNLETNNGSYRGIASNADIISLKVLDNEGVGQTSWLLEGFDWVLQNREAYNIRVVNLSLGTTAIDSHFNDPLCVKLKELVEAGIVVIAASGNLGRGPQGEKVYGDIHSPGISPYAITVGASNSFATDARSDDAITTYSSRGPTRSYYTNWNGKVVFDNIIKPELVAPGNKLASYSANGNLLAATFEELQLPLAEGETAQDRVMTLSGTSMSTPIVAGTAALLLEANPNLTPTMIKMLLQYSAQPIADADTFEQGAGMLNIEGAIRLSGILRTDLNYAGSVSRGANITVNGSAFPLASSTIAGESFFWSQTVMTNYSFLTGRTMVTRFHNGYRNGGALDNGLINIGNHQFINPMQFFAFGLQLNNNIVVSDGGAFGSGIKWFSSGVLIGDSSGRTGVLIGDGGSNRTGVLIGDGGHSRNGVLIGDGGYGRAGVLIGDGGENCEGVLIGDGGGFPGQTCDGEDDCQSGCEGVLIGDGGNRSGVLIGDGGGSRIGVLIGD